MNTIEQRTVYQAVVFSDNTTVNVRNTERTSGERVLVSNQPVNEALFTGVGTRRVRSYRPGVL
jgi:hypothetical protein